MIASISTLVETYKIVNRKRAQKLTIVGRSSDSPSQVAVRPSLGSRIIALEEGLSSVKAVRWPMVSACLRRRKWAIKRVLQKTNYN